MRDHCPRSKEEGSAEQSHFLQVDGKMAFPVPRPPQTRGVGVDDCPYKPPRRVGPSRVPSTASTPSVARQAQSERHCCAMPHAVGTAGETEVLSPRLSCGCPVEAGLPEWGLESRCHTLPGWAGSAHTPAQRPGGTALSWEGQSDTFLSTLRRLARPGGSLGPSVYWGLGSFLKTRCVTLDSHRVQSLKNTWGLGWEQ